VKNFLQAAGDSDRNYVDLCLKWGVILNGPGDTGSWPGYVDSLRADKYSERKITDLRRFCEEMADGDIVVLRIGTSAVAAVGQVSGHTSGGISSATSTAGTCSVSAGLDGYGASPVA
jgi:hypothetical protein